MSTANPFFVLCPRCAEDRVSLETEGGVDPFVGKSVRCEACGHTFLFPEIEAWSCNFASSMYIEEGEVWSYFHLVKTGIMRPGDRLG